MFAIGCRLKKAHQAGQTSSSPNPFSSRGGEGELEHQLRDVVVAFEWTRRLGQKLLNQEPYQYQIFNSPALAGC